MELYQVVRNPPEIRLSHFKKPSPSSLNEAYPLNEDALLDESSLLNKASSDMLRHMWLTNKMRLSQKIYMKVSILMKVFIIDAASRTNPLLYGESEEHVQLQKMVLGSLNSVLFVPYC